MSILLFFLWKISVSYAEYNNNTSDQPSIAPSTSLLLEPTTTSSQEPTATSCTNHPDFFSEQWVYGENCRWDFVNLTCDHDLVGCLESSSGNLPVFSAADSCCKCKAECLGQCNDPIYIDEYDPGCYNDGVNGGGSATGTAMIYIVVVVCGLCGAAVFALALYKCEQAVKRLQERRREATRRRLEVLTVQQTMTARRQRQRENNSRATTQGRLTEEERNNERYELFVTKFYFQAVLPDKSNMTANSVERNSASNQPDEERPDQDHRDDDDDHTSAVGPIRQNSPSNNNSLSSWRTPSPKDKCCICLEGYTEGETICAPMTRECNHVFHEGCILEWVKTKDHCPLCRVELF